VLRLGDGLILLPEQRRFEHLCQKISSSLTTSGLTPTDLLATLPEARNRVFAQHYGRTPQLVSLGTVPAASAGSERSTQNPPVPRLECPERRNRVALGTRQGYALALRRQGLQAGARRNGLRDEVEENLLLPRRAFTINRCGQLIDDYHRLNQADKS
jgi:hypothetical protein